jgi:hypothetical protein
VARETGLARVLETSARLARSVWTSILVFSECVNECVQRVTDG